MLGNSENNYGLMSRAIHGVMMLLIIGMIGVGIYMTGLDKSDEMRRTLYGLHKSTGFIVLLLAFIRLAWLRVSPAPKLPMGLELWEKWLTTIIKSLMYLLMLLIPLSGILMSNAKGFPVSVYGLFELPMMVSKNEGLGEFMHSVHGPMAITLAILIILHVIGALKHRYFDTGPDIDVMKRMFGRPQ
jgi:cytochrome b561